MLRASLRKEEEEQPAYGSTAPIVELGRRHLPPQHSPSSNLPFPARVLQRKVSTTSPTVPSLPPILRATSATSSASSPPLASALDDGGYFSSFRSSLRSRASSSATSSATTASSPVQRYAKLLRELPQWEQELRQQLLRHEAEELAQILHAAARVLPPVIPALRSASPRDLMLQEQARRWSICGDYYQLFLDTTELQELLHRRTICMEEEPLQRKRIVDGEVQHWIEARRLQVMRENQESAATQNEELTQRLAHFKHVQQQLYQVFLLEECERADRMEVERLQRLHVGGLAEVIAKEYRRVRRFQLRYEASRHPLRSSLASEITAEEGLHRSILSQEQSHAFKGIQAAEVRDYLTQLR
ncbi:hypothetical protein ABL78_7758 [Leptomonas seymouri]|uniref:Uncharacterized protein n=1 Tax=Leptomonas seymouri TaxID=5684 RepID=A0A0N0P2Q2_LEPSE|nr:hypothetical protein ABL78_7758 [Leptomonas seymouri]|eukprot:KPI83219.1 hypothetical protein ABL78_7758 [Leptomonas seymouri]